MIVVVVLPTPPFWLHIETTRAGPCWVSGAGSGKTGIGRPVGPSTGSTRSTVVDGVDGLDQRLGGRVDHGAAGGLLLASGPLELLDQRLGRVLGEGLGRGVELTALGRELVLGVGMLGGLLRRERPREGHRLWHGVS